MIQVILLLSPFSTISLKEMYPFPSKVLQQPKTVEELRQHLQALAHSPTRPSPWDWIIMRDCISGYHGKDIAAESAELCDPFFFQPRTPSNIIYLLSTFSPIANYEQIKIQILSFDVCEKRYRGGHFSGGGMLTLPSSSAN